jgi:hypothetical protein
MGHAFPSKQSSFLDVANQADEGAMRSFSRFIAGLTNLHRKILGNRRGFASSSRQLSTIRKSTALNLEELDARILLSGAPAMIQVIQGSNQTTPVNQLFPTQLEVKVLNQSGQPVNDVAVTFAVLGSTTLPLPSATGLTSRVTVTPPVSDPSCSFPDGAHDATTSAGIAYGPYPLANGVVGSYTVEATVSGVSTAALFTLTNGPYQPFEPSPNGLTPQEVRAIYGFNSVAPFFAQNQTYAANGQGQTIAILDVGGDPNLAADVAAFSTQFKLAQMDGQNGDPTLTQVNEYGNTGGTALPAPVGIWVPETALDVEWAHAIAPRANIVQIELDPSFLTDQAAEDFSAAKALLQAALNTAANLGASVVSMSLDTNFDPELAPPPGVTYVSAAGDYYGNLVLGQTIWSGAGSFDVTVGGTQLPENGQQLAQNNDAYPGEQVWGQGGTPSTTDETGTSWGTYPNVPLPSFQTGAAAAVAQQTGMPASTNRMLPDVSMVAENLDVINSYGVAQGANPWTVVTGTSVSTPMWAGLFAIANQGRALQLPGRGPLNDIDPVLPMLYSLPSSDFNHVTTDPSAAYDQRTGLGTPKANLIIPALVQPFTGNGQLDLNSTSSTVDQISVNVVTTAPSSPSGLIKQYVQVQINGTTSLFPVSQVHAIVVTAIAASDNVIINATPAGVPLLINLGSGTDTVTINGLGGGAGGLGGGATVVGGTGTDTLTVNDLASGSAATTTYFVTAWSIQRNAGNTVNFYNLSLVTLNGVSPATTGGVVNYYIGGTLTGKAPTFINQPGAATLNVDGSGTMGSNFFQVGGSNSYLPTSQTLNVSTGQGGANYVTVATLPKGIALNISSAGATDDTVYVGDGSEYSLTGILGAINVSNTSGQTSLVVDGSGDPSANYDLTTNSTLSVSNGPTITYQGAAPFGGNPGATVVGVTSIKVIEGSAQDTFEADSIAGLTSVLLENPYTDTPTVTGAAAGSVQVN